MKVTQDRFLECYRGGQGYLNHMAYLRLCKVFVILEALRRTDAELSGKRIFDYAFGAGTLFRYCPRTAFLHGVEIDKVNVAEVSAALVALGYPNVCLQEIDVDAWRAHPLLKEAFDVVICSHVLEHMEAPVEILTALGACLSPAGSLIAVVPIHELRSNPHHLHVVDRAQMVRWGQVAGLELCDYFESDRIGWPLQPILACESGMGHLLARAVSLAVGIPFSFAGLSLWRVIDFLLKCIHVPPSQACAIFRRPAGADRLMNPANA